MIIHSVAGVLMLAAPSMALAECTIGDPKHDEELAKVEGIRSGDFNLLRRDMRSLRSAAAVLDRYGKDEACEEIVAAINELLRNPKASVELRNKAAMKTAEEPAAKTEEQASTETTTTTAEQPAAESTTETKTEQTQTETKTETQTAEQPAAETTTGTVATQPDATAPAAPPVLSMDERRKSAVPFTERKMAMSSAELIGSDVYGPDNASIGEIDDIVVSSDDTPAYALISYGGFLGLGEDQAAVPVSEIRVSEDSYYFVDFTADQLAAAPKLKRGTSDWWTNASWRDENDAYYKKAN
jgi:hypothetical protein